MLCSPSDIRRAYRPTLLVAIVLFVGLIQILPLVAFIARGNPLAVIPVSLLLGGIGASGGLLQRVFDLPDATVNVLQGLLFICILFSETFAGRVPSFLKRAKPGETR